MLTLVTFLGSPHLLAAAADHKSLFIDCFSMFFASSKHFQLCTCFVVVALGTG